MENLETIFSKNEVRKDLRWFIVYGKLINNELQTAPKKLNSNGATIWNPPSEIYLAQGWKPVRLTDSPDDQPNGYYYEPGWDEDEDEIVQTWTLTPLPDDIDEVEAYNIIFGGADE